MSGSNIALFAALIAVFGGLFAVFFALSVRRPRGAQRDGGSGAGTPPARPVHRPDGERGGD